MSRPCLNTQWPATGPMCYWCCRTQDQAAADFILVLVAVDISQLAGSDAYACRLSHNSKERLLKARHTFRCTSPTKAGPCYHQTLGSTRYHDRPVGCCQLPKGLGITRGRCQHIPAHFQGAHAQIKCSSVSLACQTYSACHINACNLDVACIGHCEGQRDWCLCSGRSVAHWQEQYSSSQHITVWAPHNCTHNLTDTKLLSLHNTALQ